MKKNKSYYRKKCDTLFRKIIYERDNYKCRICGKEGHLNCAHIVSRRHKRLRYDERNALVLCVKCHFKGHSDPLWFAEQIKKILGELKYNQLRRESQETAPLPHDFYEGELARLNEMFGK